MPACRCPERKEPIESQQATRSGRLWRVSQRQCNHSAFNGYRRMSSRYSEIMCLHCGAVWRTAASYVPKLSGISLEEYVNRVGCTGHHELMKKFGRV
jgi:hypothetical protein